MTFPAEWLPEVEAALQEHSCELREQLGAGAFAAVFKVRDLRYDSEFFVVKVIRRAPESDTIIKDSEFSTLRGLSHPHILGLYAQWESENFHYIVLEHAPGGSLADRLRASGALPAIALRTAARQLLDALSYCHSLRVFHGDIKPANLLLDAHGRVKLADFGLAGRVAPGEALPVRGSLPYMSPELLMGRSSNAPANDIWAAAVTLFEMATGQLPWCTTDKASAVQSIINRRIVFPPDMDARLVAALGRAFDADPRRRATAEQLLALPAFAVGSETRRSSISVIAASALGLARPRRMPSGQPLLSAISVRFVKRPAKAQGGRCASLAHQYDGAPPEQQPALEPIAGEDGE
jgi:serine/threonine protein kinase